jgi:hypothetical protein
MNRGWLVGMSLMALLAGALLLLILTDSTPPPAPPVVIQKPIHKPRPTTSNDWPDETPPPLKREAPVEKTPEQQAADDKAQEAKDLALLADYPPSGRFGQQSDHDRLKIGPAAYKDMEALWSRGVRPRGSKKAMEALEELVKKYPETFRAGCANYELGLHHLRDSSVSQKDRVTSSTSYLESARSNYKDSRCDGDAAAGNMASLALAMEVYRFTDRNRALSTLADLAALPPNETDSKGAPLAPRARQVMDGFPREAQSPNDTAPGVPQLMNTSR